MQTNLRGRDLIGDLDFSKAEVETVLDAAFDLKRKHALGEPHHHSARLTTAATHDAKSFMIWAEKPSGRLTAISTTSGSKSRDLSLRRSLHR